MIGKKKQHFYRTLEKFKNINCSASCRKKHWFRPIHFTASKGKLYMDSLPLCSETYITIACHKL